VDDEKCIARVKNVTSKRITQAVLAGVVEVVVANSTGVNNQTDIHSFAKHTLICAVDKITWKGNVVASSSAEAKRRKRDDTEVRHGGSKLIDDVTMQCVDAYWKALISRKELTATKAASLPAAPALEAVAAPSSPPSDVTESPGATAEAVPGVVSPPTAIAYDDTPAANVANACKPKSSVSKKQAFEILEEVSHLLAMGGHATGEALGQCLSLMRQRWPAVWACKRRHVSL